MSAVMLLVLSSLSRSEAKGIRCWARANWLAVLALPLFAARGVLPDLISIEVANGMYLWAIAMMLVGFRSHLGLPTGARALAACAALALGALASFHYVVDSFPLRVVVASLFHGGVSLAIGLAVRRALGKAPARYPYVFTSVAACGLACGHAVRAVVSLAQHAGMAPLFDAATWNLIFFSLGTLAMPLLTLGAVMMANADIVARARYAADHDYLTGAWSRRAFFNLAEHERARVARSGGELSVLLFDVDHFKRINDTFGHAVGDRVLEDIVRRTASVIREADCCARLGGEEFAVLLPDASLETASVVAERLRDALAHSPLLLPPAVVVAYTVSIGVARLEPGETITALLCRADRALYLAKAGGRNVAVCAGAGCDAEAALREHPAPMTLAVTQVLAGDQQL